MKIIAVCGLAGAGKDTFGKFAQEMLPGTIIAKFAEPLYDALEALRGREPLHPSNKELWRPWLQQGGDMLKAEYGSAVFANRLVEKLKGLRALPVVPKLVVITDLRFGSEATALRETFGCAVSFVRVFRKTPATAPVEYAHSSESSHQTTGFANACYPGCVELPVVSNNGSLAQFQAAVALFLESRDLVKRPLTDPKRVYVAGGMQFRAPGAVDPRKTVMDALAARGIGSRRAEEVLKDAGLDECPGEFARDPVVAHAIMRADIDAVRNAAVVVAVWDEAASRGGGTHAEIAHAFWMRQSGQTPRVMLWRANPTELPLWTKASADYVSFLLDGVVSEVVKEVTRG